MDAASDLINGLSGEQVSKIQTGCENIRVKRHFPVRSLRRINSKTPRSICDKIYDSMSESNFNVRAKGKGRIQCWVVVHYFSPLLSCSWGSSCTFSYDDDRSKQKSVVSVRNLAGPEYVCFLWHLLKKFLHATSTQSKFSRKWYTGRLISSGNDIFWTVDHKLQQKVAGQ